MGLKHDWYWKRNKRKIKDYLRHKYKVIAVVPNEQIYKNAKQHLNKKVKILRYTEFDQFVVTPLEKVPSKQRHPHSKRNSIRSILDLNSIVMKNWLETFLPASYCELIDPNAEDSSLA